MTENRRLMHTIEFPMRWGDMDAFGHLNNSTYFTYFEQARISWFDSLGLDVYGQGPHGFVVVSAGCTFLQPVVYPSTMEVRLFGGEPGRSSFPTYHELRVLEDDDGELYAHGEAKVVWIDPENGRSTPLPAFMRTLLAGD